jgi:hypothetical protein
MIIEVKKLHWAQIMARDVKRKLMVMPSNNSSAIVHFWAGRYGWPLAIAVQDGMTPADIPANAEVIFIGGTTEWKWRSLPMWAQTGARVHVGRVNEVERLHICERWRVESVDGTGWMQGTENGRQARSLGQWLAGLLPHMELAI